MGVLPVESFGTLYRDIIPFTLLQLTGLALLMVFHKIETQITQYNYNLETRKEENNGYQCGTVSRLEEEMKLPSNLMAVEYEKAQVIGRVSLWTSFLMVNNL